MVYENATYKDAIKWKEIDPHFNENKPTAFNKAPSPIARFPASNTGWDDAIAFANMLLNDMMYSDGGNRNER